MSREAMQIALYTLNTSKRSHYYCEDNFYSCPKHEEGCANDLDGDECNCSADFVNETIEKAIEALRAALAQPKEWVGLTDEEMMQCYDDVDWDSDQDVWLDFGESVQAKLKENNK